MLINSRYDPFDDGLDEWGENYDEDMTGTLQERVQHALETLSPTPNQERLARLVESMTPQQFAAATWDGAPLLILAGAGTGKTRTLTVRIALLITAGLAMPSEILALTFTNKAAAEMKRRIERLLDLTSVAVQATTFHAFCARLLRDYGGDAGWPTDWTIITEDDAKRMMRLAYKDAFGAPAEAKSITVALAAHQERVTNPHLSNDQWLAKWTEPSIRYLSDAYTQRKRAENVRDFDDLIAEALILLESHPHILNLVRERFRYVLVDEYQDTDQRQERLLQLIMGGSKNLTVVGDEDQLIYTWRHAQIENILEFAQRWTAQTIKLEQNFRSTQIILDHANRLIHFNEQRLGKTLFTYEDEGDPVEFETYPSAIAEAEMVVRRIATDLAAGTPAEEIAVLTRASHALNLIEQKLNQHGIKYTLSGGKKFQDRQEIKDISAWLRLIANRHDRSAFERAIATPKRGIGPQTLEDIEQVARKLRTDVTDAAARMARGGILAQNAREPVLEFCRLVDEIAADALFGLDAGDIITRILSESGYGAMLKSALADAQADSNQEEIELTYTRLQNLKNLIEIGRGKNLTELLDHLGLTESHKVDDRAAIWIGTIHAAKGLEFWHVYLPAWEQGVLPSTHVLKSGSDIEEERRLAYVAMTRARRKVFLSTCDMRFDQDTFPSVFLADLGYVDRARIPSDDNQAHDFDFGFEETIEIPDPIFGKTDFYSLFEIPRTAQDREIKQAYRRLAMMFHPDRNPDSPDAEAKFRDVSEAYQWLIDPTKRSVYDRLGHSALTAR